MATIVARRPHPNGEVHYYYHSARREKVSPSDRGGRGPGSGPSKVVSQDIHLGTADSILTAIKKGPLKVAHRGFGLVMAAYSIVEELGIAAAIDNVLPHSQGGLTTGQYVALAVVGKIAAPRVSWRGFGPWLATTALAEHLSLPQTLLDSQNFWDAFDRVLPEKEHRKRLTKNESMTQEDARLLTIQQAIWRQVLKIEPVPLDTLLYDNTNFFSYLAAETPAALAQPGHNKAGRHEKRQVGLALAVTQRFALPLLHLTYAGNRAESKVFPEALTSLVQHTRELAEGAEHLLLVFDRGQNSKSNLEAADKAKVHVVGGLVASQHRDLLAVAVDDFKEVVGDLRVYRTSKTVYGLPAAVIVTYNASLHRKQRITFIRGLRRLSAALWKAWRDRKGQPLARQRGALQRIYGKSRMRHYVGWSLDDQGRFCIRQDHRRVSQKRCEFGKRLLFTTRTGLTTQEIIDLYNRDKSAIETNFHYIKSPDLLRFQPMRHFTDTKIRLYALVCVLGLLVLKLVEIRSQPLDLSLDDLLAHLNDIEQVILVQGPRHAVKTLSEQSETQRRLLELFGLTRFATPS